MDQCREEYVPLGVGAKVLGESALLRGWQLAGWAGAPRKVPEIFQTLPTRHQRHSQCASSTRNVHHRLFIMTHSVHQSSGVPPSAPSPLVDVTTHNVNFQWLRGSSQIHSKRYTSDTLARSTFMEKT